MVQKKRLFRASFFFPRFVPRSFLLRAAASASARISRIASAVVGREEIVHREIHLLEQCARIARIRADRAFLVGNAEFGRREHQRNGAFDAYHREKTERYIKAFYAEIIGHAAAHLTADVFGNLVARAAAATEFILLFHKLYGEADGGRDLYDDLRHVGLVIGCVGKPAAEVVVIRLGGENADIAFAAEQNAFLVVNGKTAEFLALAAGNAGFEQDLEIETDVNRIIAFVKGNRVDGDMCPQDLHAFAADIGGVIDNVLTAFGQKYFQILKTILVAHRIVDLVDVDAGAAVERRALIRGVSAQSGRIAKRLTVLFGHECFLLRKTM